MRIYDFPFGATWDNFHEPDDFWVSNYFIHDIVHRSLFVSIASWQNHFFALHSVIDSYAMKLLSVLSFSEYPFTSCRTKELFLCALTSENFGRMWSIRIAVNYEICLWTVLWINHLYAAFYAFCLWLDVFLLLKKEKKNLEIWCLYHGLVTIPTFLPAHTSTCGISCGCV